MLQLWYGKHTKQSVVLLLLLLRGCSVNQVYTHQSATIHTGCPVRKTKTRTVTAIVELKYSHNYIEIKWL